MLKSEEVCALIKVCGETGVSQLKWGDLRVNFGHSKKPATQQIIPDTEISEQTAQSSARNLEQEELRQREDELEHMLIENPLEYERIMLARELESKDSGKVDGGRTPEEG